jgi:CheY-like chemotaxis protein
VKGNYAPPEILLVDDHEDTRELMVFLLKQSDYEVVGARSIAEALIQEKKACRWRWFVRAIDAQRETTSSRISNLSIYSLPDLLRQECNVSLLTERESIGVTCVP